MKWNLVLKLYVKHEFFNKTYHIYSTTNSVLFVLDWIGPWETEKYLQ